MLIITNPRIHLEVNLILSKVVLPIKHTYTSEWFNKIPEIFGLPKDDKIVSCELTLDLKKYMSISIGAVKKFLLDLASHKPENLKIVVLVLLNVKSYLFDKIVDGVESMLDSIHEIRVVDSVETCLLSQMQNQTDFVYPLNVLVDEIGRNLGQTGVYCISDGSITLKTNEPCLTFQKLIRFQEIQKTVLDLELKWNSLKGGSWPPLEIKTRKHVKEIYIDELVEQDESDQVKDVIVLEVTGVCCHETEKIVRVCKNTPSIRCVRISNSLCDVTSILEFDELLESNKLDFLDVTTALRKKVKRYQTIQNDTYEKHIIPSPSGRKNDLYECCLEYLHLLRFNTAFDIDCFN